MPGMVPANFRTYENCLFGRLGTVFFTALLAAVLFWLTLPMFIKVIELSVDPLWLQLSPRNDHHFLLVQTLKRIYHTFDLLASAVDQRLQRLGLCLLFFLLLAQTFSAIRASWRYSLNGANGCITGSARFKKSVLGDIAEVQLSDNMCEP